MYHKSIMGLLKYIWVLYLGLYLMSNSIWAIECDVTKNLALLLRKSHKPYTFYGIEKQKLLSLLEKEFKYEGLQPGVASENSALFSIHGFKHRKKPLGIFLYTRHLTESLNDGSEYAVFKDHLETFRLVSKPNSDTPQIAQFQKHKLMPWPQHFMTYYNDLLPKPVRGKPYNHFSIVTDIVIGHPNDSSYYQRIRFPYAHDPANYKPETADSNKVVGYGLYKPYTQEVWTQKSPTVFLKTDLTQELFPILLDESHQNSTKVNLSEKVQFSRLELTPHPSRKQEGIPFPELFEGAGPYVWPEQGRPLQSVIQFEIQTVYPGNTVALKVEIDHMHNGVMVEGATYELQNIKKYQARQFITRMKQKLSQSRMPWKTHLAFYEWMAKFNLPFKKVELSTGKFSENADRFLHVVPQKAVFDFDNHNYTEIPKGGWPFGSQTQGIHYLAPLMLNPVGLFLLSDSRGFVYQFYGEHSRLFEHGQLERHTFMKSNLLDGFPEPGTLTIPEIMQRITKGRGWDDITPKTDNTNATTH